MSSRAGATVPWPCKSSLCFVSFSLLICTLGRICPSYLAGWLLGGSEIYPWDELGTVPGPWPNAFAVHVLNFCFVSPTKGRCPSISTLRVPIQ